MMASEAIASEVSDPISNSSTTETKTGNVESRRMTGKVMAGRLELTLLKSRKTSANGSDNYEAMTTEK
ncbi:hypothetical protein CEXT_257741 [Caerostris extrusa]|uniref:Uncharacterized protein n=1 Tax=Caerostris extrusa TaxID=172846 RepID=A0AAV4WHX0_CAEEX|nr:hypothetical protein CEXT_257741 [Caerostris extrusa]